MGDCMINRELSLFFVMEEIHFPQSLLLNIGDYLTSIHFLYLLHSSLQPSDFQQFIYNYRNDHRVQQISCSFCAHIHISPIYGDIFCLRFIAPCFEAFFEVFEKASCFTFEEDLNNSECMCDKIKHSSLFPIKYPCSSYFCATLRCKKCHISAPLPHKLNVNNLRDLLADFSAEKNNLGNYQNTLIRLFFNICLWGRLDLLGNIIDDVVLTLNEPLAVHQFSPISLFFICAHSSVRNCLFDQIDQGRIPIESSLHQIIDMSALLWDIRDKTIQIASPSEFVFLHKSTHHSYIDFSRKKIKTVCCTQEHEMEMLNNSRLWFLSRCCDEVRSSPAFFCSFFGEFYFLLMQFEIFWPLTKFGFAEFNNCFDWTPLFAKVRCQHVSNPLFAAVLKDWFRNLSQGITAAVAVDCEKYILHWATLENDGNADDEREISPLIIKSFVEKLNDAILEYSSISDIETFNIYFNEVLKSNHSRSNLITQMIDYLFRSSTQFSNLNCFSEYRSILSNRQKIELLKVLLANSQFAFQTDSFIFCFNWLLEIEGTDLCDSTALRHCNVSLRLLQYPTLLEMVRQKYPSFCISSKFSNLFRFDMTALSETPTFECSGFFIKSPLELIKVWTNFLDPVERNRAFFGGWDSIHGVIDGVRLMMLSPPQEFKQILQCLKESFPDDHFVIFPLSFFVVNTSTLKHILALMKVEGLEDFWVRSVLQIDVDRLQGMIGNLYEFAENFPSTSERFELRELYCKNVLSAAAASLPEFDGYNMLLSFYQNLDAQDQIRRRELQLI